MLDVLHVPNRALEACDSGSARGALQFGLAFDEIGMSERRNTEVRLTYRWRELDSNFQFRAR